MQKFHVKSIILGLGIGVVLTSIIGIIYSAGMNPEMSKDEIIARAKQYGMVLSSDIIKSDIDKESINEDRDVEDDIIKPGKQPVSTPNSTNKPSPGETKPSPSEVKPSPGEDKPIEPVNLEVLININPGDTSEIVAQKLANTGLVESRESFVNYLSSLNMESSIQVGQFKIKKGTDKGIIARVITGSVMQ
ncbi:MAG: hypothetical protein ACOYWZ_09855 [Bacillota bacterium]